MFQLPPPLGLVPTKNARSIVSSGPSPPPGEPQDESMMECPLPTVMPSAANIIPKKPVVIGDIVLPSELQVVLTRYIPHSSEVSSSGHESPKILPRTVVPSIH